RVDAAVPARIAASAQRAPRLAWIASRSTRARPMTSTPLGAISPGATGTRQGPSGTQVVPTCWISQLAAGIVAMKAASHRKRSGLFVGSMFMASPGRYKGSGTSRRIAGAAERAPAGGAQLAGGAFAAAVAPVVPMLAIAEVAGMGRLHDQFDERFATEGTGELPGGGLVDPHQRGLDPRPRVHAEIERNLHRLDGIVAAIRIAREVGFAYPGDEDAKSATVGDRRGQRQEQQIAARHEGIGQPGLADRDHAVAGQRGLADLAQHREVEQVVGAEAPGPLRKAGRDRLAQRFATLEFDRMALAVGETDRLDLAEAGQGPGKTGGRVLSSGEQDQGAGGRIENRHLPIVPRRRTGAASAHACATGSAYGAMHHFHLTQTAGRSTMALCNAAIPIRDLAITTRASSRVKRH